MFLNCKRLPYALKKSHVAWSHFLRKAYEVVSKALEFGEVLHNE
jgi:hypothetical protein